MGEVRTGLLEIRMATEAFYLKQTRMNGEFEEKFGQLSTGIEAKFTELPQELGVEFTAMQANATEVREMLGTFESRKQTMATEIASTFERIDEKGTEMEMLIDQSAEVMRKTTDQIDGAPKVVFDKFHQYEQNFQGTLAKHAVYDDLMNRHHHQGNGASSSERTSYQEARGHIHEKDIKMPIFPEKYENTEVFRRWWKEVTEYCERHPQFPACFFVFF